MEWEPGMRLIREPGSPRAFFVKFKHVPDTWIDYELLFGVGC